MALSYSQGLGTTPLLGETIGENFDRAVREHPDRDALVVPPPGRRASPTRSSARRSTASPARSPALGLEQGRPRRHLGAELRRVGDRRSSRPRKLGVILVNINPAYRTHELAYALQQSGCRLLVSAPAFKTSRLPGDGRGGRAATCPRSSTSCSSATDWDDSRRSGRRTRSSGRELDLFDDPINIQYTSGTTGSPKGATLSHSNILNNGFFVGECCDYTEAGPRLHPGALLPLLRHGHGQPRRASPTAPAWSSRRRRFEPAATLAAVAEERCTSLYGVPTMFIAELEDPTSPSYDLSSLRTGIMAGSPCPSEVMRKVIDRMNMESVTICYGMTETSPVSTQTTADDELDAPRRHRRARAPARRGQGRRPGDRPHRASAASRASCCTRGYSVMLGYWEDPERTAEAIDAARWMHTGDLATMDDEGYVKIVGRSKDMIIRGGENVYPREIEEFLYTHDAISDAAVFGVPDPRYGEAVTVSVILRDGASLTGDELREYCADKIAHYKVPKYVLFVDAFPMTVTGKVQKFKMRDAAVAELGLAEAQPA